MIRAYRLAREAFRQHREWARACRQSLRDLGTDEP